MGLTCWFIYSSRVKVKCSSYYNVGVYYNWPIYIHLATQVVHSEVIMQWDVLSALFPMSCPLLKTCIGNSYNSNTYKLLEMIKKKSGETK